MASQRCVNGTLEEANYASPMPVIGLYIAAATAVCLFSILFDMLDGIKNKKPWLPCRLFSLNSVTLTLLSIASKIPVDLTTTMPTTQDQLSKLTGTTLLCICMGFMMPSLGTNRGTEGIANAAGMSILVITIAVNICIQLHTGVIILFRTEHIIILVLMMLVLLVLITFAYDIASQREVLSNKNKDLFWNGKRSMLQRLKVCYAYAYDSNSQLHLCKDIDYFLVEVVCISSSVVLAQAVLRSLVLKQEKLCDELSDYIWSTWIIIGTQIATILIGSIGIIFRCVSMFHTFDERTVGMQWSFTKDVDEMIKKNPLLGIGNKIKASMVSALYTLSNMVVIVQCFFLVMLSIVSFIGSRLSMLMEGSDTTCCGMCKPRGDQDCEDITEFEDLIKTYNANEWSLRKGVKDLKKLLEAKENKATELFRLFTRTPPPPAKNSLVNQLEHHARVKNGPYEISSLSVVLLVRIINATIPSQLCQHLDGVLSEMFEVIHFIEGKMSFGAYDFEHQRMKRFKIAKAAFEGEDFARFVDNDSAVSAAITRLRGSDFQTGAYLKLARSLLKHLKLALPQDFVQDELVIITSFLLTREYGSTERLYSFMEQLFVDMLSKLLTQLPNAIFKDIVESVPEDYEKALRSALKNLSKVEPIEPLVTWSYVGTNITNLANDRAQAQPLESNFITAISSQHSKYQPV
ncbi:hypothetical protein Syun_009109 [Stephania yunnanensis]|uniref:Uncharacterized protein n=1 Tax=Stephania yunnanensis TaxID=152371 RepID=A0AAP0KEZ3_9MAGN